MEAIILAGGLGNRLRPVVSDVPKPMAPVNGRPFLEHLLDYWGEQGVKRFILSVGYKHEAIIGYFGYRYQNADIAYAIENQPLGTGGGLLAALGQLNGRDPFLAMNGDTFFEVELGTMRRFHDAKNAEITIALRNVDANSRYAGVSVDADGRITAFDSQARTAGKALINGGVYLAARSVFAEVAAQIRGPVSIEDELYPRLLFAGRRIYGYPSQGRFIDIGIPEDYRRAATLLSA
jgi:D-glycero-alpha-D-manno-heptose 1-phosphate guanylyltransferase